MLVHYLQKNKERIQKFKETRDSRCIYQNELGKACFQHNMVYRDFKDLTRRTASDKILHNKAFNLLKMWNIMNINVEQLQWSIGFFIKKIPVVPLRLHELTVVYVSHTSYKKYICC